MDSVIAFLARRRVALGFASAVLVLVFARPTWSWWSIGLAVALVGEGIRIWAAGHLEKNREVTSSGPYRWMRHPLYAGSSLIAVGVAFAAQRPWVSFLTAAYMAVTAPAAVYTEEAHLRSMFGDLYDRYARAEVPAVVRPFSLERVMRNKEYRAIGGLLAGFGILALKIRLHL